MPKGKRLYKARRQHRYEVLRAELFTKGEANQISRFKFLLPYIHQIRIDRRSLARDVRKLGLPRREALAELRWRVRETYQISGWKDAYAMVRWYREISIDRGEYIPPERKRPKLSKGKIAEQKKRRQARKEAEKEGREGAMLDREGRVMGWVEFNKETGKYEVRRP